MSELSPKISQYVYPAIFMKDDDVVAVSFPDLGITTSGESYEEAFLFAKDYLRTFIIYSLSNDFELPEPSFYTAFDQQGIFNKVMLIDTFIFSTDIKREMEI